MVSRKINHCKQKKLTLLFSWWSHSVKTPKLRRNWPGGSAVAAAVAGKSCVYIFCAIKNFCPLHSGSHSTACQLSQIGFFRQTNHLYKTCIVLSIAAKQCDETFFKVVFLLLFVCDQTILACTGCLIIEVYKVNQL